MPEPLAPAMDLAEFRRLAHASVDLVADYLAGIRDAPVFRPMTPEARRHLTDQRLTEDGVAPAALVADFAQNILPYAMGNGHPRFFGWVNSPPAPVGIIAELLAAAQDPSCDVGDIAALYLEKAAARWLGELVGFPPDAMGVLVSGGSMATLTGLAAARQWLAEADGWDVRADGVAGARGGRPLLYLSGEAHSSVRKAVELLGLGHKAIRQVPTDRRTGRPDGGRSASWRPPAPPTPALWTASTPSPTSAPSRACGCTSTARTARWARCTPNSATSTRASAGPIR